MFGSGALKWVLFLSFLTECPTDDKFLIIPTGFSSFVGLLSDELSVDEFGCWSGVTPIMQESNF